VNVTLLLSPEQYVAAAEAYLRGIERSAAGGDPKVHLSIKSPLRPNFSEKGRRLSVAWQIFSLSMMIPISAIC
jgi:hypothetical protein